jgi:hypothetical protein
MTKAKPSSPAALGHSMRSEERKATRTMSEAPVSLPSGPWRREGEHWILQRTRVVRVTTVKIPAERFTRQEDECHCRGSRVR